MTLIDKEMLGNIVECYVDDLIVKTRQRKDHVVHLQMVFDKLRRHQLKLEPLQSAFGVTLSKLFGFIENQDYH